jgi:hypothetical protein
VRTSAAVTTETDRSENGVRDVRESIHLEKQNRTNSARAWVRKTLSVMEMIKLFRKDVNQQRRRLSGWNSGSLPKERLKKLLATTSGEDVGG